MELPESWHTWPTARKAEHCVEYMSRERMDYTLLWLLRHWDLSSRCEGLKGLFALMSRMRISRREAESKDFQDTVTERFDKTGVRPVAPGCMTYSFRKQTAMDKALQKAREPAENGGWPSVYRLVMFQMRPGLFMAFSSWQDALLFVRDLAVRGRFDIAPSMPGELQEFALHDWKPLKLLYENQLEGHMSRIILDCDCYPSEFPHFTTSELQRLMEELPVLFAQLLFKEGLVAQDGAVRCYYKSKSRQGKLSCHVVTNVFGFSTEEVARFFTMVFKAPFQSVRDAFKGVTKTWAHVPKDGFPFQLLVDVAPMHGRHQFSTPFVGKPGETPPFVTRLFHVSDRGRCVRVEEPPWMQDPGSNLPTSPYALDVLRSVSISALSHDLVPLVIPPGYSYRPTIRSTFVQPEPVGEAGGEGPLCKKSRTFPGSALDGPLKAKVIACAACLALL